MNTLKTIKGFYGSAKPGDSLSLGSLYATVDRVNNLVSVKDSNVWIASTPNNQKILAEIAHILNYYLADGQWEYAVEDYEHYTLGYEEEGFSMVIESTEGRQSHEICNLRGIYDLIYNRIQEHGFGVAFGFEWKDKDGFRTYTDSNLITVRDYSINHFKGNDKDTRCIIPVGYRACRAAIVTLLIANTLNIGFNFEFLAEDN